MLALRSKLKHNRLIAASRTEGVLTLETVLLGLFVDLIKQLTFNDSTCIIGDLESDHFSRDCSTTAVIRNLDDQVLFVDRIKQQHVFEDMTDADIGGTFLYLFKNTEMTATSSHSILLPTFSNFRSHP